VRPLQVWRVPRPQAPCLGLQPHPAWLHLHLQVQLHPVWLGLQRHQQGQPEECACTSLRDIKIDAFKQQNSEVAS
jgi:hypothetical protein